MHDKKSEQEETDSFDQLKREAVIVQEFRTGNGYEFDAELAQDAQGLAPFVLVVFGSVANADRRNFSA